ncbi:sugar transferase [Granulicella arctica]|uniref:sugar transferase n=1 Tax=Granulicella arctica TaxID=940613 RepID=UPI0021E078EB|nr:sugar transferase [Granulicella arctica]
MITAFPKATESGVSEETTAPLLVTFPMTNKVWAPRSLRGITGWACRWTDMLILSAVFFGTVVLRYFLQSHRTISEFLALRVSLKNMLIGIVCILTWRTLLRGVGLYNLARIKSLSGYALRCVAGVTLCALLVAGIEILVKPETKIVSVTFAYWAFCLTLMMMSRALLLYFDRSIRPHLREKRNLLIVGTGSRAIDVYEEMKSNRDLDYKLIGYVDSEPQAGYVSSEEIVGTIDQLEHILMHQVIDEVVIALPMKSQYQTIGETIETCEKLGIQSQYFTHHFGTSVTKKRWSTGRATGRMVLETVHRDSRRHLKRVIDITGSFFGLILLSPFLLATAVAVKLTSKGPIIFKQERFGLNKRTFYMLKFRSMVIDAEARQAKLEHLNETSGPAFKIANDPRITPIGRFIRKMSIDELPQLVNVLLGDMSLVGPRPLPTRDVSRFSEAWLMRRFSVKPGLTCLWQVTGRSNTDFDRWIELDLEYIDNWSLALDAEILFKTVPAVLKGRGAS